MNGLKLLKLIETHKEQFVFSAQILKEFEPLFGTIKEYQDLETIVQFVNALNKLMDTLDNIFTMENFFGVTLVDFYEVHLGSDTYSQRYELLQTKISFQNVSICFLKSVIRWMYSNNINVQ